MDAVWNPGLLVQYFFHYIWRGMGVESVSSFFFFFQLVCKFLEDRDLMFTVELFTDSSTHCFVGTLGGGGGHERPLVQAFTLKGLHIGLDMTFE